MKPQKYCLQCFSIRNHQTEIINPDWVFFNQQSSIVNPKG